MSRHRVSDTRAEVWRVWLTDEEDYILWIIFNFGNLCSNVRLTFLGFRMIVITYQTIFSHREVSYVSHAQHHFELHVADHAKTEASEASECVS